MNPRLARRDFLRLSAVSGVAFASGLACAPAKPALSAAPAEDFYFVQLTDLHWGFHGAPNPEADTTLPVAIDAVRRVDAQPDFIVLTGDLTHTTEDKEQRRSRMRDVKTMLSKLDPIPLRYLPGEHDASLDNGEAFREIFGDTHWSFDHKGFHFVGLDNVSDPAGALGEAQLAWLEKDLAPLPETSNVVVFAHRPLFDLYAAWEWTTKDGDRALALLERFQAPTVFYGHIHQTHHHVTGRTAHHAARSLIFPLPAPGSAPKRAPVAWDPNHPKRGLGFRHVGSRRAELALVERSATGETES